MTNEHTLLVFMHAFPFKVGDHPYKVMAKFSTCREINDVLTSLRILDALPLSLLKKTYLENLSEKESER